MRTNLFRVNVISNPNPTQNPPTWARAKQVAALANCDVTRWRDDDDDDWMIDEYQKMEHAHKF